MIITLEITKVQMKIRLIKWNYFLMFGFMLTQGKRNGHQVFEISMAL